MNGTYDSGRKERARGMKVEFEEARSGPVLGMSGR